MTDFLSSIRAPGSSPMVRGFTYKPNRDGEPENQANLRNRVLLAD